MPDVKKNGKMNQILTDIQPVYHKKVFVISVYFGTEHSSNLPDTFVEI